MATIFGGDKNFCQDHCRGVYLPPSIKAEEIAFPRYSQFFIFVCERSSKSRWMSYLRKIGYLQYY